MQVQIFLSQWNRSFETRSASKSPATCSLPYPKPPLNLPPPRLRFSILPRHGLLLNRRNMVNHSLVILHKLLLRQIAYIHPLSIRAPRLDLLDHLSRQLGTPPARSPLLLCQPVIPWH